MPAVIIVHYLTLASHACIQLHEVLQEGSIEDNEGLVFLGLLSFGVAAPDKKNAQKMSTNSTHSIYVRTYV